MDYICKLCGQKIESNGHFWESHSQKISDYFHQFEPRLTKDNKKVIFNKDIEKYFQTDFNTLSDMKTWLKSAGEEGKEYILDLLVKRKIKKNWIYAPGQILLRLSNIPSILYYEKQFDKNFQEICEKLGFKIQYRNKIKDIDWAEPIELVCDNREQRPLVFPSHISVIKDTVKYGDYILKDSPTISIERKSLLDIAGTLSTGFDRFKREIARAKKNKGYIVIVVEDTFNNFRSIEYLPQARHIKSTYNHLSKRARELYEEFENFQLCFVSGRKEAARITEFVLKVGKNIKKIDLQYCIDSKLI